MLTATKQITGLTTREVDPDEMDRILADGATLPAVFYTDPDIAALEDELILRPSWQIVGVEPELRNPGDYFTTEIAGTTYAVPVVVLRDKEMRLRAYVNTCSHQGHLVVESAGRSDSLECAYDGWVYGLDGRLQSVPSTAGGDMVASGKLGLRPLEVDSWKGLIFVSVAPKAGLAEALGQFPAVLEEEGYTFPFAAENVDDSFEYKRVVVESPCASNWKVLLENTVECYHCPTTHTHSFSAVYKVDPDHYAHREFDRGAYHTTWYEDDFATKLGIAGNHAEPEYRFNWLWPNMFMGGGRRSLFQAGWSRLVPDGVHKCTHVSTRYAMPAAGSYFPSAEVEAEFMAAVRLTGEEDREVSARVAQRGLRSGMYTYGYTLQESERNMRHVYKMVWDALAPAFRA